MPPLHVMRQQPAQMAKLAVQQLMQPRLPRMRAGTPLTDRCEKFPKRSRQRGILKPPEGATG